MTNPIIPVATAAITDANGKLTVAGRDFLRQIVAKLQLQIDGLTSAEADIVRLLASLTNSDGELLDLSALNVDELAAIAAVQLPGFMYRDALGQWYGCTLDGQAAAASGNVTIVAPATHAAASKTTPVDADELPLVDSAASNVLKKLTWLNLLNTLWTRLGGLIAGGTGKTTPVNADSFALCDSAASNATKSVTLTNLWLNYIKPLADALYATATSGGTVPLAAAFTTIGSGLTVTDKTGRLQLALTTFGTAFRGVMKSVPATPYTIDLTFVLSGMSASTNTMMVGIALSDGTAYRTFAIALSSANGARIYSWTNATAVSGTVLSTNFVSPLYDSGSIRLIDSGTTRSYYLSPNGRDFTLVASEATNTGLTPTTCGIFLYNDYSGALATKAAITNYLVSNSVLGDAA